MLFGESLLVRKKISQDELAKAIVAHTPVIWRYEQNKVPPPIEVASKLAEVLGVSLDYLSGSSDLELKNALIDWIFDIQELNNEDKKPLFAMVDAFLRDAKAKRTYSS